MSDITIVDFKPEHQPFFKALNRYWIGSILKPAITLYEKLGFRHVPLEEVKYKRSDVKMSINIEIFNKQRNLLTTK